MRDRHTCVHEHFRSNNHCACICKRQLVRVTQDRSTTAVVYRRQIERWVNSTTVRLVRVILAYSTASHLSYVTCRLLVRVSGFEPESLSWQPKIITWLYYTRVFGRTGRTRTGTLAREILSLLWLPITPQSRKLVEITGIEPVMT